MTSWRRWVAPTSRQQPRELKLLLQGMALALGLLAAELVYWSSRTARYAPAQRVFLVLHAGWS